MASVGSPTQHGEHSDIQSPDVPEESSSTTRRDDDSPKMMSPDDSAGPSVQKRRRVTRACDECRKKVSLFVSAALFIFKCMILTLLTMSLHTEN